MNYRRIYCQENCCPYNKKHCCLGEITISTINIDPNVMTRNKCKYKKSKYVIGKPNIK